MSEYFISLGTLGIKKKTNREYIINRIYNKLRIKNIYF